METSDQIALGALLFSVVAIGLSAYSLFLQKRAHEREKVKFLKESEVKLSFFISKASYIDNMYFDQVQQEVVRNLLFNITFQISNKSHQPVIIEKVSMIFKDRKTGNYLGSRNYDFSKSIIHIKPGEFFKKIADVNFNSEEQASQYLQSTVVLRVEVAGQPRAFFSDTQVLKISEPS